MIRTLYAQAFGLLYLLFLLQSQSLLAQVDTVPPSVFCLNGISVNIMPGGKISIWSTELFQYAIDNQTPANQLELAICRTCDTFPEGQDTVSYTCYEVGTKPVGIWARDLAGNASYCKTYILVQDNNGNCPTHGTGLTLEVKSFTHPIKNFEVCYTYGRPAFHWGCAEKDTVVDVADYELRLHPTEPTYIQPQMQADIHDGVDMLDALKIYRHLMGLEVFNTPYKLLAADVNQSGKVGWADYYEVLAVAQGQANAFSSGETVKFYNKEDNVLPYRQYALVSTNKEAGFEAIKLGDVTGNATFDRTEVEEMVEPTSPLSISPNPFSHAATVQFYLPEAQKVQMIVIDVNGRRILEKTALLNGGDQWLELTGSDFDASGWYTVQLMTDFGVLQSKVLYLK